MTPSAHDETFRPSKGKWALILLLFAGVVAGGFDMVERPEWRVGGYVMIVFCGLGVLAALIQIVPGSSFLRVNSDGITIRAVWRTTFYRWSDIDRFGVAELEMFSHGMTQRIRRVGLNFSSSCPDPAKRRLNRALSGFEGVLPDNYGWDCAEFAAHLNQCRSQYVGSEKSAR
jgi:hypothetical protein